jgi:hypothetical protein
VLLESRYFPDIISVYEVSVGNSEDKKLLKRSGRRREDNIKITFNETEYEAVDWIRLT